MLFAIKFLGEMADAISGRKSIRTAFCFGRKKGKCFKTNGNISKRTKEPLQRVCSRQRDWDFCKKALIHRKISDNECRYNVRTFKITLWKAPINSDKNPNRLMQERTDTQS